MIAVVKEWLLLYLVLPLAEKIIGTNAFLWIKQINLMHYWSRDEIIAWQNKQLTAFIYHAYHHTVYYKRVFDELGIKPEDILCKEDLKKLPIIDKDVVAKHFKDIIPDNIAKYPYRKARTGGTTGDPMWYFCDENTWGAVTAAKIKAWKTTKYRYGQKFVVLGSASLFPEKKSVIRKIYDLIRSEYPLNGMNMSDEICLQYVSFIKKKRIRFIYGYAASVYLLTKYIAENKIKIKIEGVFTTSEKLTDEYRTLMETTFQCQVMDCYGAKDAGITGYEITRGELHVGYNVIPELINTIDKNTGTLLTTNFLNYAFPLIRYDFGDEAQLSLNPASYNGDIITTIIGRSSDVMRLANGNNVTGPGFTILLKPFDIVAYQIQKVGDLEVELKIQKHSEKYTAEQEKEIVKTVLRYIGEDCKLTLVYVDKFEPLKNGKRRYFIN